MAESGQNVDKQSEDSSVTETINKQGWLLKRSRLSKRWDKRWCCLKKNELSYGTTAEVQSACEALILPGTNLNLFVNKFKAYNVRDLNCFNEYLLY